MLRTLTLLLLCLALPAEARLLRLEVMGTVPAFGGQPFGAVGPYERVTARATLALDPADPRNAGIADIALALGFASQSHFTQVLRQVAGATPGRIRTCDPSGPRV